MTHMAREKFVIFTRRIVPYVPLLAFLSIALVFAWIGFHSFRQVKTLIVNEQLRELGVVADLKVRQISAWQDAHIRRGESFQSQSLSDEFDRWLRREGRHDAREQAIQESLTDFMRQDGNIGYRKISLFDTQGRLRISSDGVLWQDKEETARVTTLLSSHKVAMTDIHRHETKPDEPIIDLLVPLLVVHAGEARIVGAMMIHIDPRQFLYPLLRQWPNASKSAETLLVRRDGNDVLFLNELRHSKGSAFVLRIPLAQSTLPAVMAVNGKTHATEGIDYRGVSVVSEMRKVPGTDWFMVSKVDKAEFLGTITQLEKWAIFLGLFVTLLGCMLLLVWLRSTHLRHSLLSAQHDAAVERGMLLKHFEHLTKYANDVIFVADEAGRIIEANERATEVYGYTRDEFMLMQVPDFRDPAEDPSIAKAQMEQLALLGELRFECSSRRKDGTIFSAEISARYIESQEVKFLQFILRDITERKLTEIRLIESEARFRLMADKAPVMIWMAEIDNAKPNGHCHDSRTFFNQRWHDFTGWNAAQDYSWRLLVHPEDRENGLNACEAAYLTARPFRMEYRLRRHDGVFRSVLDCGEPRFAEDGKLLGYIGTCIDVTDQKAFEEMRVEIERIGRVNIAGEMASSLAHELSQPLGAASLYLDGCLKRIRANDWDRERLQNALGQAHIQTQRACKIINNLKELMRKQVCQNEMVNINSVIGDSINFLRQELERHAITVIQDLAEVPSTCVNRIELELVLLNLMKNALDSMLPQARRELRLVSRQIKDNRIMVTVSDTGTGMAQDKLESVFNPFQTTKQNGLGLGLGICRSLLENYGGQIWAEQRSEGGMDFNFVLPVVAVSE